MNAAGWMHPNRMVVEISIALQMPRRYASITFWKADRKRDISSAVPTVMRTQVGIEGHTRPIITFSVAIASLTSFPGRLVSSRKQLDSEGMYEYPARSSH